tara:strand:- start:1095 stop:1541 length:447 start_codon:yes stop_codon:yes gene_type:complete
LSKLIHELINHEGERETMDCPVDAGPISNSLPSSDEFEIVPMDIILSEIATHKLREIMNSEPNDVVLKVAVHRGGCSGFLYDLEIIDRPDAEGFQFDEINGIDVAITDYDSSLLAGIEIHFQDTLMGGGFKILNPNANKSCSCGISFA